MNRKYLHKFSVILLGFLDLLFHVFSEEEEHRPHDNFDQHEQAYREEQPPSPDPPRAVVS